LSGLKKKNYTAISAKGLPDSQSKACTCTVTPADTLHSRPSKSKLYMCRVQPSFPSQKLAVSTTAANHLAEKNREKSLWWQL